MADLLAHVEDAAAEADIDKLEKKAEPLMKEES